MKLKVTLVGKCEQVAKVLLSKRLSVVMMIIPYEELSSDALQGLIEEFITREGTDYGEEEIPLSIKVEQVKQSLKRREVVIVFDVASESVSIITRREADLLDYKE